MIVHSLTNTYTLSTDKQGKGLEIAGTFGREQGEIRMHMTFTNKGPAPLSGFAIQFNRNSFALAPAAALYVPPLQPGANADTVVCWQVLSVSSLSPRTTCAKESL